MEHPSEHGLSWNPGKSGMSSIKYITLNAICTPWLQNNTNSSRHPQTMFLCQILKQAVTSSHLAAALANTCPLFFFFFLFPFPMCPRSVHSHKPVTLLTRCLSSCLSAFLAPASRDEREEPLAHAGDHHHLCDWCHSDCCLGDRSSFAE